MAHRRMAKAQRPRKGMDIGEVAAELGVSDPMARKLVKLKRLPHYKIGARIVVDPVDVAAFKQRCRVEAAS